MWVIVRQNETSKGLCCAHERRKASTVVGDRAEWGLPIGRREAFYDLAH